MMNRRVKLVTFFYLINFLIALLIGESHGQGTSIGFYSQTCPNAEKIVRGIVQTRFQLDNSITPALLRLLFHDSFAGSDASLLLDPLPGKTTEKNSGPNLTVRGYDIIQEIKDALEAVCPGIVSCADIIALATRDSVTLVGGPSYAVPTGRRDSLSSNVDDASILPGPSTPVTNAINAFHAKGLTTRDFVVLLGAHTVGVSHCSFFSDRVFDFEGTGKPDPTMNKDLVKKLSTTCSSRGDPTVFLDQGTTTTFDSSYYTQLGLHNGILQIDQEMTGDPTTSGFVNQFTSNSAFFNAFTESIVKLMNIGVLTGNTGEIRRRCNVVNPSFTRSPPPPTRVPPPPPIQVNPPSPPPTQVKPPPPSPITRPPPTPSPLKPPPPPPSQVKTPPPSPIIRSPPPPSSLSPLPPPPTQVKPPPPSPIKRPPPPPSPTQARPPPPPPSQVKPPPPSRIKFSPPPPFKVSPSPPPPIEVDPSPHHNHNRKHIPPKNNHNKKDRHERF